MTSHPDSSREKRRHPAGAGSVSGYLLASDVSAVFLGAERRLVLNEQVVDLPALPGESKRVFVCERAACVLVMGLHAASAPPAWARRCRPAFLWRFSVRRQRGNRRRRCPEVRTSDGAARDARDAGDNGATGGTGNEDGL